ncbi:MAG: DNRLRE domain-containing protein, partial [Oscillospiraceae bacterium]|nr:DNRLRE domain-containing protein [Oscillospiraceae bacterium]
MKVTKKIISVFLCFLLILSTCSVSINVFAEEINETVTEEIENIVTEETENDEGIYILSEITEDRTEYTKTFRMSDGSFTLAQYSYPIHFLDEDDIWQDYDNSFEEKDELYTTASRKNPISLSLKAQQGKTVFVENEQYPVSWGYNNAKASKLRVNNKNENRKGDDRFTVLDNLTQSAEYKNIYPHVDLEYIVSSNEVKENLVLNNNNAATEYQITYNIGNLAADQTDSKTIELKSGEETIYIISAPIMYDNNGEISEELFLSILEEQNGVLTVDLSVDSVWLKSKERAFPVIVDPAFVVETDYTTVHTAFVNSGHPADNLSSKPMELGYESSSNKNCRILMKFVLPSLNPGDMIVSAEANFYIKGMQTVPDTMKTFCVSAHTVTSAWDTSVENSNGTFNKKSGTVTWNTQPSFKSTVVNYTQIDCTKSGYWANCDITSAVKGWYEGTLSNFGILLKSYDESKNSNSNCAKITVYSERDGASAVPCLTLVYRNNKGLEDYWTYTSVDSGTAGTAYVNDYSGNLVLVHNTASTSGLKMPVSINHVYNGYMFDSFFPSSYPKTGMGWKLSIQQTVKPSGAYGLTSNAQKSYPYAYEDGDGTVHFFYKKDSQYLDEDGLGLELKVISSGYTITDKKDNVMTFNSNGNLKTVADAYGNKMTISYVAVSGSEVIDKVTDGAGHIITFSYSPTTNLLTNIREPDGKSISFSYTSDTGSDKFLSKIKYPDGTYSTYHYNANKQLEYSVSADGTGLNFKYDSGKNFGRVNTVIEKAGSTYPEYMTNGQKITFDRSEYNMTVIRSSGADSIFNNDDDVLTTYQFDNFGRTISVSSKITSGGTHLGANTYTYTAGNSTSNLKQVNKVTSASGSGKYVNNLLKNHSAEVAGSWSKSYWINASTEYATTSTNAYSLYGKKSLKINVTKTDVFGGGSLQQNIDSDLLKSGNTYTFSAYVKIAEALTSANSETRFGACIAMRFVLEDGSVVRQYSSPVSAATVTGWQRLILTDTVPENTVSAKAVLLVVNSIGTAYFDGMQLEKTNGPSEYNLLENASFETVSNNLPSSWSASNFTSSDVAVTSSYFSGSYSIKMVGEPNTDKQLYQTVNLPSSSTEKDTYILTAWAKATSVPIFDKRLFDISVKVTYSDSSAKELSKKLSFNDSYSGWQFASAAFTLSDETSEVKTPSKLTVYINYGHQANTAYFDCISLFRDDYNAY